jgi:hypothetical protein
VRQIETACETLRAGDGDNQELSAYFDAQLEKAHATRDRLKGQ